MYETTIIVDSNMSEQLLISDNCNKFLEQLDQLEIRLDCIEQICRIIDTTIDQLCQTITSYNTNKIRGTQC